MAARYLFTILSIAVPVPKYQNIAEMDLQMWVVVTGDFLLGTGTGIGTV